MTTYSAIMATLLLLAITGLGGCDSTPPKTMKAVKQFKTDEERERHMSHIRKDHMILLKHKRNETMYKGIRTEENSLKACINCHVPVTYKGKVLRHTDPEHFCSTCHGYVAAQLDCFQCHVDHPVEQNMANAPLDNNRDDVHAQLKNNPSQGVSSQVDNPLNQAPVIENIEKKTSDKLAKGVAISE